MTSKVIITLSVLGESHATEISVIIKAKVTDWNLIRKTMGTLIENVSFNPRASTFLFTVKEI